MLLLVLLAVIEGSLRAYDQFNPQCDLITNEVYQHLSYDLKRQICKLWFNVLWYEDLQTSLYTLEPNQHSSVININSHGFRGPEIEKAKDDNTYRIFMLGGSTTVSLRALSDDHTITGYLQKNLSDLNFEKKIQVINAGIPALTSTGELKLVQKKLVEFDPDLIIIYDGANDIYQPLGFELSIPQLRSSFADVYHRFFSFYETPSIVNGIIKSITISKTLFNDSDIQEKVSLWKNNLETICEIGMQEGFHTLVVLQPILGTGNKPLTEHEISQYDYYDHERIVPAYQSFGDALSELDTKCTKTIDLRNIFDEISDSVYFDNSHVSYRYYELIVEELSELVVPLIQIEKNV